MLKPKNPCFSSGPTAKRPGWSLEGLTTDYVSRSHRSHHVLAHIEKVLQLTRQVLEIPETHKIAIMPGSCTGALEAAFWNLLGCHPVDVFSWDVFSLLWYHDLEQELKLDDVRLFEIEPEKLYKNDVIEITKDIVFTWNGTTTGKTLQNLDWIPSNHQGLVISDITSAVFVTPIDWSKLDAAAFSWQKGLGGEAGFGMLILSPRSIERLENYHPTWAIPRIFRLKQDKKINYKIFEGFTLNTPSLLCMADFLDALEWAKKIGGLSALIKRTEANLNCVTQWVEKTPWVEFCETNPEHRSSASICLRLLNIENHQQWSFIHKMNELLEKENVAFDIAGHAHSYPCLRIWGGPTVEFSNIQALLPWLDKAYLQAKEFFQI